MFIRNLVWLSWIPLCAIATSCPSQESSDPVQLQMQEETQVPTLLIQGDGWQAVPGDGKLYVKTGEGRYTAVNFGGQTAEALNVKTIPVTASLPSEDLHVIDLSPDSRGGVLAPVVWEQNSERKRAGVLRFDAQGAFSDFTLLNEDLFPTQVASFSSSGNILVAGYDNPGEVHLAIFETSGKMLVPKVPINSDEFIFKYRQSAAAHRQARLIVGMLRMVSGDDDAVYIYYPPRGRKVFRITPDGNATEIRLSDGTSANKKTLQAPHNFLIFRDNFYLWEQILEHDGNEQKHRPLSGLCHTLVSVYDRKTGGLQKSYQIDSDLPEDPGTIAPAEQGFYFLKSKSKTTKDFSFWLARAAQ